MVSLDIMSLDTLLSSATQSMRDDLKDVKTAISYVSNISHRIMGNIETHESKMNAELTDIKGNLTQHIGHTCGGTEGWRQAVYLDLTNPNTSRPSGLVAGS